MFQTFLSRLGWFVVLIVLQVLVFNHVHIMGYATPMPYVYFIVLLPSNTPRWAYILFGFVMGLVIDLFACTPGMASGALTLTALLAPMFLKVFGPSDLDEDESFLPGSDTMEWGGFLRYATPLAFIHVCAFFLLETFSFFDLEHLVANILSSTLLTFLFLVALEMLRSRGAKKK